MSIDLSEKYRRQLLELQEESTMLDALIERKLAEQAAADETPSD